MLPAIKFLYGKGKPEDELEKLWKSFCDQYIVSSSSMTTSLTTSGLIPCWGHRHIYGEAMLLKEEHVIARPVWIYWDGVNTCKPSDLLVTIYDMHDRGTTCITTLNRYELIALTHPTMRSAIKHTGLKNLLQVKTPYELAKINIDESGRVSLSSTIATIHANVYKNII
ncbi:MAG: hypothetical protein PW786_00430 [Arachidicoccus sp.]|nr:hypothetical protein [Arachidicoccus sp.]